MGTPSTFLRLHGCHTACTWCDTKDSWKLGSKVVERSIYELSKQIRDFKRHHIVVTGGDPMLQQTELIELFKLLGYGYHITVETQAATLGLDEFWWHISLASLSPKLVSWDEDKLRQTLYDSSVSGRGSFQAQVKLVVTPAKGEDVSEAISRVMETTRWIWKQSDVRADRVCFIIQPESSLGRSWLKSVTKQVEEWLDSFQGSQVPDVRVMAQFHKSVYSIL